MVRLLEASLSKLPVLLRLRMAMVAASEDDLLETDTSLSLIGRSGGFCKETNFKKISKNIQNS